MAFSWSLKLAVQNALPAPHQQGILDLVRGSGLVVQGILYILVFFSVMSWGIIAQKLQQIRRAKKESAKFIEIFWERRNLSSIHDARLLMRLILWHRHVDNDGIAPGLGAMKAAEGR